MKFIKKSEWFELDSPIAEPDVKWFDRTYWIERVVREDGSVVWYGQNINWKKEKYGNWTVLSTNKNAKPLEKYLPDIVYGEDRTYWEECDLPLYERLYIELSEQPSIKMKKPLNKPTIQEFKPVEHKNLENLKNPK